MESKPKFSAEEMMAQIRAKKAGEAKPEPFPETPMEEWPQSERDRYDAMMEDEGIDLGVPETKPPNYIEASTPPVISEEEIMRLMRGMDIDPDPRGTAARLRTRRTHMVRKLKNRFNQYVPFSSLEAAQSCKMGHAETKAFLEVEVRIPGSLIKRQGDGDQYVITSAWL